MAAVPGGIRTWREVVLPGRIKEYGELAYFEFIEGIGCLNVPPSRRRFGVIRLKLTPDRTWTQVIERLGHTGSEEARQEGVLEGIGPTVWRGKPRAEGSKRSYIQCKQSFRERKLGQLICHGPRGDSGHCRADLDYKTGSSKGYRLTLVVSTQRCLRHKY